MTDPRVIIHRVGEETNPTSLLLSLADMHGIRDEVFDLAENAGKELHVRPLDDLLRTSRTLRGTELSAVCRRCNMSRSQLSAYEDGRGKNPGIRTIQALSYGYRLPFMVVLMSAMKTINPRMRVRKRVRPNE